MLEKFLSALREGRWDQVMELASGADSSLRQRIGDKIYDLYELLIVDLACRLELNLAQNIMQRSSFMATWREEETLAALGTTGPSRRMSTGSLKVGRFSRLEALIAKCLADPAAAESFYPGSSIEQRRAQLAGALEVEMHASPSDRLLSLLGDAIKYNLEVTAAREALLPQDSFVFDLFQGLTLKVNDHISGPDNGGLKHLDLPISTVYMSKRYASVESGQNIEVMQYTPDGSLLGVGKADGTVEIFNAATFSHRMGPWRLGAPIMAMAFASSHRSLFLIIGLVGGDVVVLACPGGTMVTKIGNLHAQGISVLCVSPDGESFASAGYDETVKISSVRSGTLQRQFRGHASFVNDVCFAGGGRKLASVGVDGRLCIWDINTATMLHSLYPGSERQLSHGALQKIFALNQQGSYLCCTKDGRVICVEEEGEAGVATVGETLAANLIGKTDEGKTAADPLLSATISWRKMILYVSLESGALVILSLADGAPTVVKTIEKVSLEGVRLELVAHPKQPLLLTFDLAGNVQFWKP